MLPGLQPAHLEADQVRIEYRNSDTRESPTLAVDGVSLDVARNDFVCIVGPSGCGKTTFLNAVAGFIPIQGGVLRLDGDDIPGPGPDRAMVFQQPSLLPWRKVIDNVKSHGDQIRRFMTAVQQAIKREKSDEAYATSVLSKHLNVTDPKALHETWAYYTKVLPDVPTPTVEQLQTSVTELAPTNPAVKNLDLSTLVDPSFVSAD